MLVPLLFWFSFSKFITNSTSDLVENTVLFFWEMHIIHKYMLKKIATHPKIYTVSQDLRDDFNWGIQDANGSEISNLAILPPFF